MCDLPEAQVRQLIEAGVRENARLQREVALLTERIKHLERLLARYHNPHTPPSRGYPRRELVPPGEQKKPG